MTQYIGIEYTFPCPECSGNVNQKKAAMVTDDPGLVQALTHGTLPFPLECSKGHTVQVVPQINLQNCTSIKDLRKKGFMPPT
jgi:hypothetical protein